MPVAASFLLTCRIFFNLFPLSVLPSFSSSSKWPGHEYTERTCRSAQEQNSVSKWVSRHMRESFCEQAIKVSSQSLILAGNQIMPWSWLKNGQRVRYTDIWTDQVNVIMASSSFSHEEGQIHYPRLTTCVLAQMYSTSTFKPPLLSLILFKTYTHINTFT